MGLEDSYNIILDRYISYRLPSAIAHSTVGRDEPSPAVAWYWPDQSDIFIDFDTHKKMRTDEPTPDPESLARYISRFAGESAPEYRTSYSILYETVGFLAHEAAHSQWSTWKPTDVPEDKLKHINTMMTFEEARVEKRAIDAADRPMLITRGLRAIARLILGTIKGPFDSEASIAYGWALIAGRRENAVFTDDEFDAVDMFARTHLGDEVVDQLSSILGEAVALELENHGAFERLIELAEMWDDLVGIPSEEITITICHHPKPDHEGEDEGEGECSGGGDGGDEEGEDGPDGTGNSDSEDGDSDDDNEQPTGAHGASAGGTGFPDMEHVIKKVVEGPPDTFNEVTPKLSDSRKWGEKIFKRDKKRSSRNWSMRPPTSEEVLAANTLASHLESLAIPTIDQTSIRTMVPSGKLRSREAVRGSAERARGRMVTARPWTKHVRRHTTSPPITVGIATDTSGSMGWAQEMVASAAYIVGRAGKRINARTAAVTFGSVVESVLHPEEIPSEVRIRAANGGVEELDKALASLDGVLHLTETDGVKLLIIVSDNELVIPGENAKRAKWMEKLHRAGVILIWVDSSIPRNKPEHAEIAVVDRVRRSGMGWVVEPAALVSVITRAIDKAVANRR
jgi:hypothetical protein